MAYCPKCKNNYQIVTSTTGSSYNVPVTTERYNAKGDYIGYEETETYDIDIDTYPRCSNCYSVLKFPNATTKEEFERIESEVFYSRKNRLLEELRAKNPVKPSLGGWIGIVLVYGIVGIVVGFIVGLIVEGAVGAVTGNSRDISGWISFFLVLGIAGIMGYYIGKEDYNNDLKKYKAEIDSIDKISSVLSPMDYTHENYEKLKSIKN